MVNVGLVILNWNGYEDTLECLRSIDKLKLSGITLRLIVVDNSSIDNSVLEINKFTPKNKNIKFKLLVNKDNYGFAKGNNIGIYYLSKKVDHILILNNDTLVDENLMSEFIKFSKKHSDYGILSPKIYFAKGYEFHKDRYKESELGNVIWAAGGEIDWDNVFGKNRGVDEVDKGQFDKVEQIEFATGAAMLINVDLVKKIGGFDERYFMYFEDADLVVRSSKIGFKSYYLPKAKVWHKVAQSSAIGGNLNDYFITRNRLLFGTLYAPIRTKLALFKESFKFALMGRKWQRIGTMDFYLRRFGKGSWKN